MKFNFGQEIFIFLLKEKSDKNPEFFLNVPIGFERKINNFLKFEIFYALLIS